jgi:hypothetical protein
VTSYETRNGPGERKQDGVPEGLSEVIDFSGYDLCTTLRLIALSGECRQVKVRKGSRQGAIYISAGEIQAAVTKDRAGDEALFESLSWEGASHVDLPHADPLERNISTSTQVLLEILKKEVFLPD